MPTIWYMTCASSLSNGVNKGQKVTKIDPSLKLSPSSEMSLPRASLSEFLRKNMFKWKPTGTLVKQKLKKMDVVHI